MDLAFYTDGEPLALVQEDDLARVDLLGLQGLGQLVEDRFVEIAKDLDGGQELVKIRFDAACVVPVVGVQERVEDWVLPFRVLRKSRVDRKICIADVCVERSRDQHEEEYDRVCGKGDLEGPREDRVNYLLQQEQRVVEEAAEQPADEPERPCKRPEEVDGGDLFRWYCKGRCRRRSRRQH